MIELIKLTNSAATNILLSRDCHRMELVGEACPTLIDLLQDRFCRRRSSHSGRLLELGASIYDFDLSFAIFMRQFARLYLLSDS